MFLTGDLGYQMFEDFKKRFGSRYVNVGIAEAQMVCAAAGLASEGFRPFVYSIGSFMVGRPFEQIRVSVAYPGLPVVIVGAGGGYCYSASGVTHHAAEDLALMSLLPGMTVVAPGDPHEVKALLPQLLSIAGPSYIRIGKFGEPELNVDSSIQLGKARLLREGSNVAILTTGELAPIVYNITGELLDEGIFPLVYHFHTVKPLDTGALDRIAKNVRTIIVVEESTPIGGLAASVAAWQSELIQRPNLIRLGPPDVLALGNPTREALRDRFGFGPDAIKDAVRKVWPSV
jgi:transketolase